MCCIVLSVDDPVVDGEKPDGGLDYRPKKLQTFVEQYVREVGPRVVIEQLPTGEPKFDFLPTEAIHLGEALIRLGTMATDDTKSVKCESCEGHPI
jgi:hypothetical protein